MKAFLKKHLWSFYLPLSMLYYELVLQLWCFGTPILRGLMYITLFTLAASGIVMLVCAAKPGVYFRKATTISLFALFLIYGTQAVYYHIFRVFLALHSVSQAGTVFESFWRETLTGIFRASPSLVLLFIPTLIWMIFGRKLQPESISMRPRIIYALMFLALQTAGTGIAIDDTSGVMSAKYLYTESYVPELAVRYFGIITNEKQDFLSMREPDTAESFAEEIGVADKLVEADSDAEPTTTDEPIDESENTSATEEYGDNVLEIDFESLISGETNETIAALHEYFSSAEPSSKNEYTGMWEGKNLIWIVAEGFSSWAVDEQLTPTLYKLANSGFVFENYYNPVWYVSTSDGEFTTMLSLFPRSGQWSMSRSSSNTMPFGMGNLLGSQRDYSCYAFHDGWATYYDRDKSHPNLGYEFYARGQGLDLEDTWPPSDVEMIEETVPMYIDEQPFHTYYMTISGHMYYTFTGNQMSEKHREEVEDLPYSDNAKAYAACNIELDQAIEKLIDMLSEAGILENTAIVLSGDHYPYALEYSEIEELNGGPVERSFELYHSTLIMWSADMTEPVYVEKPCYSLDVMPTICNLFGLEYDSRLVMGRDILSDSEPLVVFSNRSYLTDKGRYDASTDVFTPAEGVTWESDEAMEEYASSVMEKVNDMFDVSAKVIDYDYYSYIFKDGAS